MAEDELEPLITECPNCSTRFRVTESQLQVASGRVRCGACLTVFHGIEFLVWDDADAYASEAEARDALDQLLEELDEDTSAAGSREGGTGELADLTTLGADPIADPVSAIPAEFWEEDAPQFYAGHEDDVTDQTTAHAAAEAEPVARPHADDIAEQDVEQIVSWGGDGDPLEGARDDQAGATRDAGEPGDDPEAAAELDGGPISEPHAHAEAAEPLAALAPEAPVEPGDEEPDHQTGASPAVPAAAEISFAPEPRRWWIGVVAVLAILALGAQVLWFQFDRWGRDPTMRPVYASFCELAGCQLPVMRDLEQLKTNQLMVRSNPEMAGALIVDVVIVNQAQFAQPFPVLELRFTTIDGSLVAGRRFQPAEYLAGELASATDMEPMTPVRIELEIEDPGGDAVNYFLSFR